MADGKIYITISDKRDTDNEIGGNYDYEGQPYRSGKDYKTLGRSLSKYAEHQFFHIIRNTAVEAVNYSVGNIGFFTGNYQKQRNIQSALSVGQSVLSIGESAIAGFTLSGGNPIGAAIGASVAIVGMGVSATMEIVKETEQIKRTNYAIDRLRDISGLNGLTNGSR